MNPNEVTIWTKYGGTKFILVMVCVIWGMFMLEQGIHPDEKLLNFILWVISVFLGVNTAKSGIDAYRLSVTQTAAAADSAASAAAADAAKVAQK